MSIRIIRFIVKRANADFRQYNWEQFMEDTETCRQIQCYCYQIGVEPKRPIRHMDVYELMDLNQQIKEREAELGMTPIEIATAKNKCNEKRILEVVIVCLAIGLICGVMLGAALWKH